MLYFGTTKSSRNHVVYFANITIKLLKIVRLIKLTVLNSRDYAIFKTPRYFEFGSILREVGPQGSFGSIFGSLKFYVVSMFL